MFIMNVATDDPIRVIRKYEEKSSRLLSITCPATGKKYRLIYAIDEIL